MGQHAGLLWHIVRRNRRTTNLIDHSTESIERTFDSFPAACDWTVKFVQSGEAGGTRASLSSQFVIYGAGTAPVILTGEKSRVELVPGYPLNYTGELDVDMLRNKFVQFWTPYFVARMNAAEIEAEGRFFNAVLRFDRVSFDLGYVQCEYRPMPYGEHPMGLNIVDKEGRFVSHLHRTMDIDEVKAFEWLMGWFTSNIVPALDIISGLHRPDARMPSREGRKVLLHQCNVSGVMRLQLAAAYHYLSEKSSTFGLDLPRDTDLADMLNSFKREYLTWGQ